MHLLMWLNWIALAAWIGLGLWGVPATIRLIRGCERYYDPLHLVFLLLALSRVGYGANRAARGFAETLGVGEAVLMSALLSLSIIGALFAIVAIRSYERTRDGSV